MIFRNVTVANNEFDDIYTGAITVNPMMPYLEGMPIFDDWKFIGNKNNNELGTGAIALYTVTNYASYPVSLNVTNWLFDGNEGNDVDAIRWIGVNLIITDT